MKMVTSSSITTLFVFVLWATVLHAVEVEVETSTTACVPPCRAGQGECILLRYSRLSNHLSDRASCNCSEIATGYYYGKQCQHYQQNVPCDPPCKNGGECSVTGKCNCQGTSGGYDPGDCSTFSTDPCNPACENGGSCLGGGCQCKSATDWYYSGSHCEQAVQCTPACGHGKCFDGFCSCDSNSTGQYEGKTCATFTATQCTQACVHGECTYGYCSCYRNSTGRYTGSACDTFTPSKCAGGCLNGGGCGDENTCQCRLEYTGANCETHIGCPCQNNGSCDFGGLSCFCTANSTGYFQGQLCDQFVLAPPCYPSVINGGWCILQRSVCPYDDIGYFHGDQCEQYSPLNCSSSCVAPEVCVGNHCRCPYNVAEGYTYFDVYGEVEKCSGKFYMWYEP